MVRRKEESRKKKEKLERERERRIDKRMRRILFIKSMNLLYNRSLVFIHIFFSLKIVC